MPNFPESERAKFKTSEICGTSKSAEGFAENLYLTRTHLFDGNSRRAFNKASEATIPNLIIDGFLDGSIREPARALAQLSGDQAVFKKTDSAPNAVSEIARIAGSVIPFSILALSTRFASLKLLAETATPSPARHVLEQSVNGFIYGSMFTPSEPSPAEALLSKRLDQGVSAALTFAAMSGSSGYLSSKLSEGGKTLNFIQRSAISAASGAVGGLVDAETESGFKASPEQLVTSAAGFAIFGTAMESASSSIAKLRFLSKSYSSGKMERLIPKTAINRESADTVMEALNGSGNPSETVQGPMKVPCLEVATEKLNKISDKTTHLLSGEKIFERREEVLEDLSRLDQLRPRHSRFLPILRNSDLLTDVQKLRIIDSLCQLHHLESRLNPANTEVQWSKTTEFIANSLRQSLKPRESAQRIDKETLEENLLVGIFSTKLSPLKNSDSGKDLGILVQRILKKQGYQDDTISRITQKLTDTSPSKDVILNADLQSEPINTPAREETPGSKQKALNIKLEQEHETFEDNIFDIPPERFPKSKLLAMSIRIKELNEIFLERDIPEQSKAVFFKELNRMLTAENAAIGPRLYRWNLAEQVLNHAARPLETIHQGSHNTCNVTTCENRIYSRAPHTIAKMIADLAIDGHYISSRKTTIHLSSSISGLAPDREAARCLAGQNRFEKCLNSIKRDGERDWSSQLVQTVMAKLGQKGKAFYLHKSTMTFVDQLCYDKDFLLLEPVPAKSLEPVYNKAGRQLDEDEASTSIKLYRKDGNYIQELSEEQLIYDEYGKVKGCVADKRLAQPLFDSFGNRIGKINNGQFAFDQTGQISLHKLNPKLLDYDLISTPSGKELERLHTRVLGQRIYIREIENDKRVLVDSPYLGGSAYRRICNEITNDENMPISIRRADSDWRGLDCIDIKSVDSLGKTLQEFQEKENMPCIVIVDTRNAPWKEKSGGLHVINVQEYDAANKKVKATNQWGSRFNFMDKPLSLQDLFRSMNNRDK